MARQAAILAMKASENGKLAASGLWKSLGDGVQGAANQGQSDWMDYFPIFDLKNAHRDFRSACIDRK